MTWGSTPDVWAHLVGLGLLEDLLPVVANPRATISPSSKLRDLGKTPSRYDGHGQVVGIPKWTQARTSQVDADRWARVPDLGICVQTRRVRAVDIDISDQAKAQEVLDLLGLAVALPMRRRPNSGKCLLVFDMPGDFAKRVIRTPDGIIEFLATGQQFVFDSTHPSGVRYEWQDADGVLGLPAIIPAMVPDEFEGLWDALAGAFAVPGGETRGRNGLAPVVARRAADSNDPAVVWLGERGWLTDVADDGRVDVRCPWGDGHSTDSGPSSTSYFPAGVGGFAQGHFRCLHASCAGRTDGDFFEAVGYSADGFEVIEVPTDEAKESAQAAARNAARERIPEAKHLTTDLANANRIRERFGRGMIVVAGQWHAWTGKRWEKEDSAAYRNGCRLSALIHAEADEWLARKASTPEEAKRNAGVAEALKKWAVRSEMKATIEAALALLRKMLAVDEGLLNRDPWLVNCSNGTVDTRTGTLQPHDPADYITHITAVSYVPGAPAVHWERVLARVTCEEGLDAQPLAGFLRRWFGYCLTGSTREQKFAIHWGGGSNGKSTILDTLAEVLGDYAATAAPGLMVSAGRDRHPTEVADLFGRRMVTAHETGEGGALREDFVKQATGSDKIKARFMRADFFEFSPTHKLQLLTNHKPVIKGGDFGIWRRVLLVPYQARFEDEPTGAHHYPKDPFIAERLKAEAEGVLAWTIAGAAEWYANGLRPPARVLAATKDYQVEQDRVGQFVEEMCEVGAGFEVPLGDFGGLYEAYRRWCGEGGMQPLAKNRLVQELERVVPGFEKRSGKVQISAGKRKDCVFLQGLRLLGE